TGRGVMSDETPTPERPIAETHGALDQARAFEAKRAIEAVIMAAVEPVPTTLLAQLVELPVSRIDELVTELSDEYERDGRGFVIARVAGGFRYQTHPEMAPYVERFVLDAQHARLSPASLETLAIVAYKQPISRMQVSAIRGVNVDATLKTLLQRGYVDEVGHDPGPGNATLFGTSPLFLERLGINSIADLPPLADFVPDAHIVEMLERGLRITDDIRVEDEDVGGADDESDESDHTAPRSDIVPDAALDS
ncbi:MAG TPA: SMC-Scp complex subunit ScpB, partial [Acidimicrobiia bacterium]|nr:SMC-Scp complex subunit ScpB [Acidimicrobiia bacterium]